MADDGSDVNILNAIFKPIIGDLKGAEGPVFDKNQNFFMVAPEVEVDGKYAGQIFRINLDKREASLLCEPNIDGDGGIPAGCQVDQENNLWVADMRLGLLKVKSDGTFSQVAKKDSDGNMLQGCNDCAFDFTGTLWVTAPAGDIAPAPYRRSFEEPFGSVYCQTQSGETIKIAKDIYFPNGIAVHHTPDGKPLKLIVAETPTKSLWAFDIVSPGKVENKQLWGKLPGDHTGGPDGMDFDSEGNLLVANWGSGHIEVFGPGGGKPITRIKCPFDKPSNIHFRPDSNEVYVTEHTFHGLWKFDWKNKGQKQFCELA